MHTFQCLCILGCYGATEIVLLLLLLFTPPWSATLTWWWGLCSEDPNDM